MDSRSDSAETTLHPTPRSIRTPQDHRVELAGGDWALWRDVCLRSAGFSLQRLDGLGAQDTVSALEALSLAEGRWNKARERAVSRCREGVLAHDGEVRRRWRRVWRVLSKGRVPHEQEEPAIVAALIGLQELTDAVAEARSVVNSAFAQDLARIDSTLRDTAADPRVREAVIWQNADGLRTGFDTYLACSQGIGSSRDRLRARLVCKYLQRYCTKNETIGFFGPVAWARFSDSGPGIEVLLGHKALRQRQVTFEHWAMRALADSLMREPGFAAWLAPRLSPAYRLDGGFIVDALGRRAQLPLAQWKLLLALDGVRSARVVALELSQDPSVAQWSRPQDVARELVRLVEQGLVIWQPDVPVAGCALSAFQQMVGAVGDDRLRTRLHGILGRFQDARRRVIACAGDSAAVGNALEELGELFEAQCGQSATRLAGRAYAGRTLVYEDCELDLETRLGPAVRRAIERPLSLILDSARWMTWRAAGQYMEFVADAFGRCAGAEARVPLVRLWQTIQSEAHVHTLIVDDVAEQLQQRWDGILGGEGLGRAPLMLDSAVLEPAVAQAFAAPGPGWPGACVHSPDIMLCADSPEAFDSTDGLAVLGELHAGFATVLQPVFAEMSPGNDGFVDAVNRDLTFTELTPVPVIHEHGRRTTYDPPFPNGLHIEFDATRSWRPREQVASMAEMEVARVGDRLEVRTLDGRIRLPAVTFFGTQLRSFCMRAFSLFSKRPHRARVTIDRLVVSREQWVMGIDALSFAFQRDALKRFTACRNLARTHGLPRYVFARSCRKEKPLFVDFHSPILVDLFAKQVRDIREDEDAWVALSEMLPGPQDCWLKDHDGNRYTSELRFTVVDNRPWKEEAISWPAS